MFSISHCLRLTLAAAALLSLAGCDDGLTPPDDHRDNTVDVRISISASPAPSTSRAGEYVDGDDDDFTQQTWDDSRASEGEMMRNCFAVAVQQGKIVGIIASGADYDKEKSMVSALAMRLDAKPTTFYSFANIRPAQLGIDTATCVGSTAPDFDNMTYSVSGNANSIDAFGSGIPMSGRLQMDLTDKTQEVDLEVTRMVAKAKVSLTNDTPADFKVLAVSLSDITDNANGNLMLMPRTDEGGITVPNIATRATKSMRTVPIGADTGGETLKANRANTVETTFYINESVASEPKYFVVNVETNQTTIAHRVALLTWNTISRGDYIDIPIRLNDYRLTYDVEQFTAIGVLPSVDNNQDMLTVRFRSYGEFHMRPTLTRLSDGHVLTPGTDAADGWTLADWQVLELWPEGGDGSCIYDRMPYADHSRRTFEGYMGNRKGYALHQVLFHIKGLAYDIPYKVQIIHE